MGKLQSKKSWLMIGSTIIVIIIIIGGLNMFKIKTDEERRNQEHEVSLVKALKNTYAELKEIKVKRADYSDPPGSWSCIVELKFEDGEKATYSLEHSLGDLKNASAIASDNDLKTLQSHYGATESKVAITYSDGRKEVK